MARKKKSSNNPIQSNQKNQKHVDITLSNKGKSPQRHIRFSSQEFESDLESILENDEQRDEPVSELEAPNSPIVQITHDDVAGEVNYWSTSVFCYILGANPPSNVISGFVKRVWQAQGLDKVSFMPNGIFLARFKTKAQQQAVLSNGHLLFDNKPVIVKEWTPETLLVKHDVTRVPIWMKIFGLDVKYWGLESLKKLCGTVGTFIKCDSATAHRDFLGFARIMIEVDIGQNFPTMISFNDEHGVTQSVRVVYDWLPLVCTSCKGMGHLAENCRKENPKPGVKKAWRPKVTKTAAVQVPKSSVQNGHHLKFITRILRSDTGEKRTFTPRGMPFMEALSQSIQKTKQSIILNRVVERGESSQSRLDNGYLHKGGRIWLMWDPQSVIVDVCDVTSQCIHTKVFDKARQKYFWFTVVYGFNKPVEREPLWDSLRKFHGTVTGPWLVCGDFNAVMGKDERIGGNPVTLADIRPLLQVVQDCNLADLTAKGNFFTWTNKHVFGAKVYSKIDRALCNDDWMVHFPLSYVHFLPEGMFDHSPCLVRFDEVRERKSQ
ncbi:uncharacterized protein LOC141629864 [Silene latifolia]|uniref:uncharacterized protein LOC141629864 n=1 Tax=Silene latifolia TaxID=37657 RepID=UPI003D77F185